MCPRLDHRSCLTAPQGAGSFPQGYAAGEPSLGYDTPAGGPNRARFSRRGRSRRLGRRAAAGQRIGLPGRHHVRHPVAGLPPDLHHEPSDRQQTHQQEQQVPPRGQPAIGHRTPSEIEPDRPEMQGLGPGPDEVVAPLDPDEGDERASQIDACTGKDSPSRGRSPPVTSDTLGDPWPAAHRSRPTRPRQGLRRATRRPPPTA